MASSSFNKSVGEKSNLTKIMQSTKVNDRISIVNVPYQGGGVVLMKHPASLTLYKYVSVSVLSGTVSINGYDINKETPQSIKVFSSEKTGLIEIKTEGYESIWKRKTASENLGKLLINICQSEDLSKKILQKFGNCTVALFIKRCTLPCNVEFVELYYPHVFEFNLCKRGGYKDYYCLLENKKPPLQFGEDEEKLASEIIVKIRSAKLADRDNPRVLVCGPRNTGKSMLLQYLVNRMLSQYKCVHYLDTDPGQPEFTPPGVVSLTKVKQPILGPPFLHQKDDAQMVFTGHISPEFIEVYSKGISNLMKLYTEEYSHEPLFVNTMGWMEGTGLQCLIYIITTVKPTVLVEIVAEDEISMFDYREYLPSGSDYFQICCKHEQKTVFSPKEMRELSLLSYFGKCQAPYLEISRIQEFQPYCVSWDKIPLFIFPDGEVLPSRMAEAFNGSIVALCSVPETSIKKSDISEFPKTLESDPENQCLAYGLVQAIDEREHILYIISPLKKDKLSKVNALIKGNIMTPDALILQQEKYDMPLPNVDEQEILPTDEEMMDIALISMNYESEDETETPASNLNVFPSFENYRKPIGKRHRQKFLKKYMKN